MSTEPEARQIAVDMRPEIVCPLCLKIAIKSEGRLGAIQSYRCQPKPTKGGWETRPQKDKWESDFFKVINAGTEETVTLSDGKTQMQGIDRPSDTRLEFTHEDGVKAKKVAIQYVLAGKLRAPRNWDKVFSEDAGMMMEELKNTYPEVYSTSSRASAQSNEETEVEALGSGFFDDDEVLIDQPAAKTESLDENDDELIRLEEDAFANEQAYSVASALELDELDVELKPKTAETIVMEVAPPEQHESMFVIHESVTCLKVQMDGQWVLLFKVVDAKTGHTVWVEEGLNHDLSHIFVTVKEN